MVFGGFERSGGSQGQSRSVGQGKEGYQHGHHKSSTGSPVSIEKVEECTPCKAPIWLWKPYSDAINELFEKWEAGFVAWNNAFHF
jgi:hypothetical protein